MNLAIEPAIEDATKTHLSTSMPTVDFFVGGSQSEFITPRVEIHVSNVRAVDPLDMVKEFSAGTFPNPLVMTEANKDSINGSNVRFFNDEAGGQNVTVLKAYAIDGVDLAVQLVKVIDDDGGDLWLPVDDATSPKNRGTAWDFTTFKQYQEKAKFDCDLSLTVVTDLSQGTTRTQHFEIVNDTRNLMSRHNVDFGDVTLPDFDVYDITLESTEREIDGELTVTAFRTRLSHHLSFVS